MEFEIVRTAALGFQQLPTSDAPGAEDVVAWSVKNVLVKCAICGFEANVNPRIAAIYGHRPHRSMNFPPRIWICDIHRDVTS